jgi:hypothetical protein
MGHMSPGVWAAAARALKSCRTSASSACRATSNARGDSFFYASVHFISRIGHCSVAACAAIPNACTALAKALTPDEYRLPHFATSQVEHAQRAMSAAACPP